LSEEPKKKFDPPYCPWCGSKITNMPKATEKEPMILNTTIRCLNCDAKIVFSETELGFNMHVGIGIK